MDTNTKIKKLAEKIHREGVEKANKEAEEIISRAKEEASAIIGKAKEEAEAIRRNADKEAAGIKEKLESEIRLSSRQAIASLRKEIGELVQAEVVKEPVEQAFDDNQFVSELLGKVVDNWSPCKDDNELHVLLPGDNLKEVESFFRKRSASVLNKGVNLRAYNGSGKGFEISPGNGHYKISMTDEAFNSFLQEHFRKQTMDFLFGNQK